MTREWTTQYGGDAARKGGEGGRERGWGGVEGRGNGGPRRAKNHNEIRHGALQFVSDTEPVSSLQSWVARICMTFDIVADIVAVVVAYIVETSIS